MLIIISTSGGIGGTGLGGTEKRVETDSLDTPLREKVCDRFDPATLKTLAGSAAGRRGADRVVYHLTVIDGAGDRHRFDIPEAAMPANMLDMLDTL